MYHFVKMEKTWYLKAESLEDVIEHFKTVCGREFKKGIEDWLSSFCGYCENEKMHKHPITKWRCAVENYGRARLTDEPFIVGASRLENETLKDRIKFFLDGKILYFRNDLAYMPLNEEPAYDEEIWKDELQYPENPGGYTPFDVEYIKWPGGTHYYAKIGGEDVVVDGEQKWNSYTEAKNAVKKYLGIPDDVEWKMW